MRRGWRRTGAAMLLACWPAAVLAVSPPDWVSAFPHDPDAYVGVGVADKRRHPGRYREVAQAAALAQISREISVSLRSEESLARREDARGWEESWNQEVRADSRNDLSGYRLVDVHETEEEFRVYYALDKKAYARIRESRLEALAASLEALLASRALPEALRRLPSADPAIGPASDAGERLRAVMEGIRASAREAVLVAEPGPAPWTFDPAARDPAAARIRLAEGGAGRPWKGPFTLSIRDGGGSAEACRVEVGGEGFLDLARPFLDCGLDPGRWRATWVEGGFTGATAAVETRILPRTWALDVRSEVTGMIPWKEKVASALESLPSPYWRIHREGEAGGLPRLEIRLSGAESDSLDGLHFAALRGTVRLPGGGAYPVTGKGGHADAAKAKDRAARDFASEVGKRLAPPGKPARPLPG